MDHKGEHTHLGGTALVQFNGTLLKLGLFIEGVPAEVKGVVTEVTWEFSSGDVLHDGKLQETDEGENLKGSGNRDGGGSIPARSKIRELGSGVVDVSWKVDSGLVDKVSDNTKHTDTSVLDLDVTKAVETLLGGITRKKSKRIEESKWRLGTKFILKGVVKSGRGDGLLGRSESSGGGDKGGKDGGLHFVLTNIKIVRELRKTEGEESAEPTVGGKRYVQRQ